MKLKNIYDRYMILFVYLMVLSLLPTIIDSKAVTTDFKEKQAITGLVVSDDIIEDENGYRLAEDAVFEKEIKIKKERGPLFMGIRDSNGLVTPVDSNAYGYTMTSLKGDYWTGYTSEDYWGPVFGGVKKDGIVDFVGYGGMVGDCILTHDSTGMDDQVKIYIPPANLDFYASNVRTIDNYIDYVPYENGKAKTVYALFDLEEGEYIQDYTIEVIDDVCAGNWESADESYYTVEKLENDEGFRLNITDKAKAAFCFAITVNTNLHNEANGNEIYNVLDCYETWIELQSMPAKTQYYEGEYFDALGLTINYNTYNDFLQPAKPELHDTEDLKWDITSPLTLNDKEITIMYTEGGNEHSCTYKTVVPIKVYPKSIQTQPASAATQETATRIPQNSKTTNKADIIAPAKVNRVTLSRAGSNKLKLSYKKVKQAKGYQISYSTNKRFAKAKKIITKKNKYTFKKLKKGKTYYVRVRAYKLNGSKKVYGKWSSTKKMKVK